MWGAQVTSKKSLHLMGKRFGLSNIYDKRINIHPDMPIVDLDPYCISILKNLTGNDDDIEIEIKGLTPIEYKITLFLAFAIQQLPGFNIHAEKEIDSIMRRVVLVEYPVMQEVNREFKKSLIDPTFLDQLYSWLVVTNPVPFYENYKEEEEWIQYNKNKWLMNADPILRILLDNYEYKEKYTVKAYDVVQMVKEQLMNEGMLVPKSVKTQITNAFSTMNISNNGKRGSNCLYENCRQIDPEDVELAEILAEVEKEEGR
jgi:phage/plasmid-associated DNA primase